MSATPATAPRRVGVVDVTLPVVGQDHAARAWLVAGDDDAGGAGRSRAGVLWLHWLGHRHNDRGEFLALAVELASRGVVSLLPAGHFPWVPDPDGTTADARRVRAQVEAHAAALDLLAARPGVDPDRIAVVGHDYGGMYGALLAAEDDRVTTLALQAVDATWEHWFSTYWLQLDEPERRAYAAVFAGTQPVEAAGRAAARLGRRVLLQWAGQDTFVTADVRAAYEQACPDAHSTTYEHADHMLGDTAARDLVAFLADRLGLDQN